MAEYTKYANYIIVVSEDTDNKECKNFCNTTIGKWINLLYPEVKHTISYYRRHQLEEKLYDNYFSNEKMVMPYIFNPKILHNIVDYYASFQDEQFMMFYLRCMSFVLERERITLEQNRYLSYDKKMPKLFAFEKCDMDPYFPISSVFDYEIPRILSGEISSDHCLFEDFVYDAFDDEWKFDSTSMINNYNKCDKFISKLNKQSIKYKFLFTLESHYCSFIRCCEKLSDLGWLDGALEGGMYTVKTYISIIEKNVLYYIRMLYCDSCEVLEYSLWYSRFIKDGKKQESPCHDDCFPEL